MRFKESPQRESRSHSRASCQSEESDERRRLLMPELADELLFTWLLLARCCCCWPPTAWLEEFRAKASRFQVRLTYTNRPSMVSTNITERLIKIEDGMLAKSPELPDCSCWWRRCWRLLTGARLPPSKPKSAGTSAAGLAAW